MEDVSKKDIIVKYLSAFHAARKDFIEVKPNDKLHCALKAKNRITTRITYEIRYIVYYKHKDSNRWKGPRKVIGKEDKQILVNHGGYYIRVHPLVCSWLIILGPTNQKELQETMQRNLWRVLKKKNSNNDSICTSDDEGESYPVDKVGKVDNVQAN